jgi:serine protease
MVLNGQYGLKCGTSMSAPYVSGVGALVWSKFPSWSNVEVRGQLQLAAVDIGYPGRDDYFGFGRIDAVLALTPPGDPGDPGGGGPMPPQCPIDEPNCAEQ